MQSLRILHVTPYFADAWAYGGIPRLAHAMTRGLVRRGHQVTVCTTDACDASSRLPARPVSCTADGVDVRVFPNVSNQLAYGLQFFLPRGLNRYLRRNAGSFDVAHLHACRNVPGAIAAHHLTRAGVPYLLQPNGTAPRIERRKAAKAIFDLVAGRRVMTGATRVVAVTNAETRQLRALGVDSGAIRVVPNPIDLDEFAAGVERGRFRSRAGLEAHTPIVLYLGTLTPRKRLDVLAHACARLGRPEPVLVIAGNDMGSLAGTRALVRALGLERRTLFAGLLRGRERLEALADATVVVYPSEDEIFGLVPLEAILSGTPVIVADDSGCGEVVKSAGGGLVAPLGDADALAQAIARILDSPAEWRRAACAAGANVRARFGEPVVCERIEAVYREMVRE